LIKANLNFRLLNLTGIEVQICDSICMRPSAKQIEGNQNFSSILCIPKCCGINSILAYEGTSPMCKIVGGNKKWQPFIYSDPYHKAGDSFPLDTPDGIHRTPPFRITQFRLPCSKWQEKLPATDLSSIHKTWVKRQ